MSRHVNAQHLAAAIDRSHPAVDALNRVRSWAFSLLRGQAPEIRDLDNEKDRREIEVAIGARILELCEPVAA